MAEDSRPDEAGSKKASPKWPWFAAGAVVIVFVIVVLCIIFVPSPNIWTDDAYVTAHYSVIAPRVAGADHQRRCR